jgi:ribokinase
MAIWNLGSINIDYVYRLPHLPRPGETLAATEHAIGLGGKGANQSIAAARAGRMTRHLGAIGPTDDWIIAKLRDAGVCTADIQRLPDQVTGHAIILLDQSAENSIVIHSGANRAIATEWLERTLGRIGPGDTLLLQNETNCQIEAARIAKTKGARVIYSAAPFEIASVQRILPHVDILAMNAGEADQLFAALKTPLQISGLLITKGGDGAEYRDLISGQVTNQAAFPVTPIDTTGAGDTFAGYFATALDRGDDLPEALRLAAAAAALQVTRPGAGEAIPAMVEVLDFLESRSSDATVSPAL